MGSPQTCGKVPPSAPSLSTKEESETISPPTSQRRHAPKEGSTSSTGRASSQRLDDTTLLTHEQRVAIAQQIKDAKQRHPFFAGDTANLWEEELGEDFWNIYANEFGYTYPSLRNVMRVCKAIPPNQRHDEMSFAHHEAVKTFDIETRDAWLERAFGEEWPVKRLREELVEEGLLKTKPKVKRWTLEELRTKWAEWPALNRQFEVFLDWLGEQ